MALRRGLIGMAAIVAVMMLGAGPALACAGLVGKGGTVHLFRTTTLAGYHDGVEHYITSFTFSGGGAKFGSLVPLPGVPTSVTKGGEWTLQRLELETQPPLFERAAGVFNAASVHASPAEVLLQTRIDALDLTVLRGGGKAVGDWARQHGFSLSVDAPEVLDYYASRSPVFLAASFDPAAARARGQGIGSGTPIHLAIPTANPWVPLRILGLGRKPGEPIQADVYLLTDRIPALLPEPVPAGHNGVSLERLGPASLQLIADLQRDKGNAWIPGSGMWLTYLRVNTTAARLQHDLAVDVSGRATPSPVAAGIGPGFVDPDAVAASHPSSWGWLVVAAVLATGAVALLAYRLPARRLT
jgi:hypothetical protein